MPAKPKKTAKAKKKAKKASLMKFKESSTGVVLRIAKLGFAAEIPSDFNFPIVLAFTRNRGHMEGTVPPVRDDKVNKNKT